MDRLPCDVCVVCERANRPREQLGGQNMLLEALFETSTQQRGYHIISTSGESAKAITQLHCAALHAAVLRGQELVIRKHAGTNICNAAAVAAVVSHPSTHTAHQRMYAGNRDRRLPLTWTLSWP